MFCKNLFRYKSVRLFDCCKNNVHTHHTKEISLAFLDFSLIQHMCIDLLCIICAISILYYNRDGKTIDEMQS